LTDLSATTGVTDRPSGAGFPGAAPGPNAPGATAAVREFLDRNAPETPCLVLDVDVVRRRYGALSAALPDARICYAVKANPDPAVVAELVDLGSSFDVASPGEIDLCLGLGAAPEAISYGNPIKKPAHIAHAHERGVRLFATDSAADVDAIAANAPGAQVFCRLLVGDAGARTPFGRKFGCAPDTAVQVLRRAAEAGLDPVGLSFHIGSQQLDPVAWDHGIAAARRAFDGLAEHDIEPHLLNLGGGLPASYTESAPELDDYTARIESALDEHFGPDRPELLVEPGRHLVGDAAVLRSEVVLVNEDSAGAGRWIYLDVGRYNGLAETEGEAITYRIRTSRDGDPTGPVVLAGPTCDGDDVLYQRNRYELPLTLRQGDWVELLSSGAYTASYSSVGFNGFAPLPTHVVDGFRAPVEGLVDGDRLTERP